MWGENEKKREKLLVPFFIEIIICIFFIFQKREEENEENYNSPNCRLFMTCELKSPFRSFAQKIAL